eukprot:TRINITY_DN8549_c0_g1_i1.p1 TRINITY_DN8549_c0_g1~~TRINITY_DN8549_c0_g1_i1.p1  ORF type:complete len:317 (+),score=72.05 TRINITY_DN8549_c0_g1_i1:66-1016(+)
MKPLLISLAICAILMGLTIHQVEEGHVGVYWRGGALLNRTTGPGFHLKLPLLDNFENVQVTVQTDKVTDIPCGTSGGVMIKIERVEVVNRLKEAYVYETIKNYTTHYDKIWIFDKIHHEINQFCSKHTLQEVYIDLFHTVDDRLQQALEDSFKRWAPGIEIVAIRITKPRIPAAILKQYEEMEAQKAQLLVSIQAQKVAEKEAETEKKRAIIEAEKLAQVSNITVAMQLNQEEGIKKVKAIQDEILLNHERALTDSHFYKLQKAAEANKALMTEEYLKVEMIRAIGNTTKVYFGPSVNAMYLEFLDLAMSKSLSTK